MGSSLRAVLCWVQLCSHLQVPRPSIFVCGPRPAGGLCHPFTLSRPPTMQSTTAKSLSRIRRHASTDSRVGANSPNHDSMLAFFVCR